MTRVIDEELPEDLMAIVQAALDLAAYRTMKEANALDPSIADDLARSVAWELLDRAHKLPEHEAEGMLNDAEDRHMDRAGKRWWQRL